MKTCKFCKMETNAFITYSKLENTNYSWEKIMALIINVTINGNLSEGYIQSGTYWFAIVLGIQANNCATSIINHKTNKLNNVVLCLVLCNNESVVLGICLEKKYFLSLKFNNALHLSLIFIFFWCSYTKQIEILQAMQQGFRSLLLLVKLLTEATIALKKLSVVGTADVKRSLYFSTWKQKGQRTCNLK